MRMEDLEKLFEHLILAVDALAGEIEEIRTPSQGFSSLRNTIKIIKQKFNEKRFYNPKTLHESETRLIIVALKEYQEKIDDENLKVIIKLLLEKIEGVVKIG